MHSPLGNNGDVFVANNGDVYKFDADTLFFAIARPNGVIRTFSNLGDDKTKTNAIKYWNRQIKEKDRKLLQKAKLCFQEAAKLGHTGTKTQIEKIDTELSKL